METPPLETEEDWLYRLKNLERLLQEKIKNLAVSEDGAKGRNISGISCDQYMNEAVSCKEEIERLDQDAQKAREVLNKF